MMETNLKDAFLTGSHAYGKPKPSSDVDLVVMLEGPAAVVLVKLLRTEADAGSDPPGSMSLKFGKLNLIVPNSLESLQVWRRGTAELSARKPVTRIVAVDHFEWLRKQAGIL